jgi:hypothetical protein
MRWSSLSSTELTTHPGRLKISAIVTYYTR